MTDHYKNIIINGYKNSGISSEAQIITNELLAKAKNSTQIIAQLLLALNPTKYLHLYKYYQKQNSLKKSQKSENLTFLQNESYQLGKGKDINHNLHPKQNITPLKGNSHIKPNSLKKHQNYKNSTYPQTV